MSKKISILLGVLALLGALFLLRNKIAITLYYSRLKPPENVQKRPLPVLDSTQERELTAYLKEHFQRPEEYILSKFQTHDIVFLGEMHRVRHDVQLVQHMIPLLYKHGIYNLGIEFACRRDQNKIDTLVRAASYNPLLANQILFNYLTSWSYREYADIFKTAWKLNHSLPASAPKFRIVGLHPFVDWSYVNSHEDLTKRQIMAKVFPQGRNSDSLMARIVLNEFVGKHQKALIYCGLHHAFTRYYQPIYNAHKKQFESFITSRMGNIVYREIGERAFTICLHQPWVSAQGWAAPQVYPVDGQIDALMHKLGPEYYPVGFDTHGTPFGKLPGETSLYKYGYSHFTLADFCDGYIFQKPLSEYRSVRHIKGFINKNNLEQARLQLSNPDLKNSIFWKLLSPAAIDSMMYSDANIEQRIIRFY